MSFSRKIFAALFIAIIAVGSLILWGAHYYLTRQGEEAYRTRYSVVSKVLGDTLTRLESNTEALMLNAAKVVAERDKQNGVLSTSKLKKLRDELNVTHLFVVDDNGNFIRST